MLHHSHTAAISHVAGAVLLLLGFIAFADQSSSTSQTSAGSQIYWVEQIAMGLKYPSSMAWLPNGDMLITERMGGLRRVRHGELDPQPVAGVPPSYQDIFDGLKGVVVDPDYSHNLAIYLFLAEGTFEKRHAAVYRARYDGGPLTQVNRVFRSRDDFGGFGIVASRITLLNDRTLLLAVPEDHHAGRSQQLDSDNGKILRINLDGSVPDSNPFVKTPGAYPEIWSYGHRTPLGIYEDKQTGKLWEVEAGELGGDELNALRAGANYGWPKASWGFAYGSQATTAAPLRSGPGMDNALLVWMPSATPSGLTRYRGPTYPSWNGDFFIGHLTDRLLERVRIDDRRVVLQEKLLLDLEERIRDVSVGPDDRIYILTDHQNGRVLRLQPGRPLPRDQPRIARRLEQTFQTGSAFPTGGSERLASLSPQDVAAGRQAFIERCASCHHLASTAEGGGIGPDLDDVYGRRMGHRSGYEYSPNMAGGVLAWEFNTLDQFLANPPSLVPGTKMASPPIEDAEIRRNIIGFLKQRSQQ